MVKTHFPKRLIALSVGLIFTSGSLHAESLLPVVVQSPNAAAVNNPIDPDTKRPAPAFDPYSSGAFDSLKPEVGQGSAYSQIKDLVVQVEGLNAASGMLPADGMTPVPVKVKVLDAAGQPVKGRLIAKIKADGVRIAPQSVNGLEQQVDSIGWRYRRF